MKKYLMSGVAALALCAAFTSCSKNENLYDENRRADDVISSYNDAFIKTFGQPAANQDWGFGSVAATRGFSTNHNLWGDPEADGGVWNFKVPPALTERQKLRVKLYFQYNPWLTYQDPEWTDFFVQQVYKGGDAPIASQSLEVYPTGDNKTVTGGQQMDQLSVGYPAEGGESGKPYYDHVNDFNNGTYDHGNYVKVLNTGESTNDYNKDGCSHEDQITLMQNSKSDCVGYWSSNGSTGHNDRCALASALTIDQWAASDEAKALNIDLGDPVYEEEWNRSFVGLDYDGIYGDNIYAKVLDANWQTTNEIKYAKIEDAKFGKEWAWDGKNVVAFSELIAADEYFRDKEGNKIPYTIEQRNMFIGENCDFSQNDFFVEHDGKECVDLTLIYDRIDQAALPKDGCLYEWTKNIGGRDHVYSDWIVTLTKAEKQNGSGPNPPTPQPGTLTESLRVIAEDLTVDQNTDFDFNDVVFDVTWSRTVDANNNISNSVVSITLKAAGGTLPLYVDGKEVHQLYQENNMTLFINQYTMINTHAEDLTLSGISGLADITWTTTNYTGSTIEDIANSIDVMVKKNGQEIHLAAPVGGIASKIGVKTDYEWCNERQDIEEKYKLIDNTSPFREWVRGIYPANDWYSYAKDEIDKYKANKIAAQAGN